jgi:hypothetical protein
VDNAVAMRVIERVGHLDRVAQDLIDGQHATGQAL